MIRDEIKNKIQLETINVNKTIENKRRWIESKEKINWRADINFLHGQHAIRGRNRMKRKEKEKKRKAILDQITFNHNTRTT